MANESLRAIPSVDRVMRELGDVDLPRPLMLRIVRRELEAIRAAAASGESAATDPMTRIRHALENLRHARLRPVINATGVVIHTNFGRSPLPGAAAGAIADIAAVYCNLEFDLATGQRGSRAQYVSEALAAACDAESAAVVNNCAAALVLILRHFTTAAKPEVVISRGELVQIGGGFRVPEILQAAGATLREVGTTNRTTLADYEKAAGDRTAMILKVHRSNFYMAGFVESPGTAAIAEVARNRGVLFVEDLGSGAMGPVRVPQGGATGRTHSDAGDPCPVGVEIGTGLPPQTACDPWHRTTAHRYEHEPTPAEVLAAGADLVSFSGDKLLGGPQAGVIAGKAKHVAALRADPLFRALRCDKLVLAAMQATLDLHLAGGAGIPTLDMMRADVEPLRRRAKALAQRMSSLEGLEVSVSDAASQVGGGSLPRTTIPSVTLDLAPRALSAEKLAARLRRGEPPVVGYIHAGRLRLDLRTVFPHQDDALAAAILRATQMDAAPASGGGNG
jgi:L-seryl-tRNA(Ser) seleniumtransferase